MVSGPGHQWTERVLQLTRYFFHNNIEFVGQHTYLIVETALNVFADHFIVAMQLLPFKKKLVTEVFFFHLTIHATEHQDPHMFFSWVV